VEKNRFLFLLRNNASLSAEETSEIGALQIAFPYSQVIHNLAARGAQLNNLPNKQIQLNSAAVYSTDRTVLKTFITSPARSRSEIPSADIEKKLSATPKPTPETKAAVIQEVQKITSSEELQLSGDALIDEVFHDLELLKKSKHDFELVADGFELPTPLPLEKDTVKAEPKTKKDKSNQPEGLIAEIKNTKKKIKPSDPRQKEQLEIIEQFIKSKPALAKNKVVESSSTPDDLAESSSVFSDNIISETLVEILIRQGKKEKAVEVLKKLIWKFPQKKAYFAAQIEELTK